jgi:hypothetical protein
VNEEERVMVVHSSATPDTGDGIMNDKEKIDIEMGNKREDGNHLSLPEILRNLNYDDLEENMKTREDEGITALDSLLPTEQDMEESGRISTVEDGKRESVRISRSGDTIEVGKQDFVRISNSKDEKKESADRDIVEDGTRKSVLSDILGDGTRTVKGNDGNSTVTIQEVLHF